MNANVEINKGLTIQKKTHCTMVINQPVEIKKCLSIQEETISLWLLSAELPMCQWMQLATDVRVPRN